MKKVISLLLTLLMLCALFVPVNAAANETAVFPADVLNSVTEEDDTGRGLAFRYTMDFQNTDVVGIRTFKGATVTIGGTDYPVVKMGAIITNQEETGKDASAMVIENVTGLQLVNKEAEHMYEWDDTKCTFAVRVINIPTAHYKSRIYARPYYIYKKDGQNVTVYGEIANNSCFGATPVELPAVGTDIDVTKKKNRIRVSASSHYVNADDKRVVSLTFKNYTSNWITEETDYVKYTCYDANGTKLTGTGATGTIYIGVIDTKKHPVKTFEFVVPDATAQVKLTSSKIVYWTEWA